MANFLAKGTAKEMEEKSFAVKEVVKEEKEMENNKAFEEEIDLVWLFFALFKRLWLIIAVAVVCACGMAGYTHFRVEPTYTSTSTMLVLTKETTLTSLADLQLGSQLTKDYTVLISIGQQGWKN